MLRCLTVRSIVTAIVVILLLSLFSGCGDDDNPASSPGYYIGNKNTKVFHKPSCSYLPDPENRVRFDTRQAAIDAGYAPCQHCNP